MPNSDKYVVSTILALVLLTVGAGWLLLLTESAGWAASAAMIALPMSILLTIYSGRVFFSTVRSPIRGQTLVLQVVVSCLGLLVGISIYLCLMWLGIELLLLRDSLNQIV